MIAGPMHVVISGFGSDSDSNDENSSNHHILIVHRVVKNYFKFFI